MTEWIKTSERMPGAMENVIVFLPGIVGSGYEIQIYKGWKVTNAVSHWMPLPEKPEPEDELCVKIRELLWQIAESVIER